MLRACYYALGFECNEEPNFQSRKLVLEDNKDVVHLLCLEISFLQPVCKTTIYAQLKTKL